MLILLIIDKNKDAAAVIYSKHHKRMLYVASKLLGEEAGEDAVHDAFVKLIEKNKNNFSDLCDKPGNYFVKIVRNHSLDLLRKEHIESVFIDLDEIPSEESPEKHMSERSAEDELVKLIRSLSPALREVLELKSQGFSNAEIADELDISLSAVTSRLKRGRTALKEKLEERMGDGADD